MESPSDVSRVGLFKVVIAGEKSFPDVDTLIIGSKIDNISIPNELFPNIKRVISYSNEEHLREILKLAQSAFDTTAAAYILKKLKETEKNINYEV